MTENLHVQGYLAYWDALRRRHPGMLIDSCASGGRRNDIETLRRAVPLLRSDYQAFDGNPVYALGNQCQTYGLSSVDSLLRPRGLLHAATLHLLRPQPHVPVVLRLRRRAETAASTGTCTAVWSPSGGRWPIACWAIIIR